jgi:proteic killer suppression protein
MEISYRNNKLKKICTEQRVAQRELGLSISRRLQQRMSELTAAACLSDISKFPPARCHQLSGNHYSEFTVDIDCFYRLVFIVAHDPVPMKDDRGIDLDLVTEITILRIDNDEHNR